MSSERDGRVYVKNLAHFIRANEVALANALMSRQAASRETKGPSKGAMTGSPARIMSSSHTWIESWSLSTLWRPRRLRQHTMSFNPHQLYYLMDQIGELGIHVGPLDVRSEHVLAPGSSVNYISFLKKSGYGREQSERGSVHSVSSVRSVVSTVSDLFRGLGTPKQATAIERIQAQFVEDLTYIFSAFTKIPSLRLSPMPQAAMIAGYEEYPFDTAVPLNSFKNLSALEITDLDYRGVFGWHLLADSLRSLIMKRAALTDPIDLLHNIVVDDMDNRKRRTTRSGSHWRSSTPTPTDQFPDTLLGRGWSTSQGSPGLHDAGRFVREDQSAWTDQPSPLLNHNRDPTSRQISVVPQASAHTHPSPRRAKRSGSGSSNSSRASLEPFRKNSYHLLIPQTLPESKWQFLRHLGLPDNALARLSISCFETLHSTLQSLDLSSNLFTEIPNCVCQCTNLKALDISNCLLDTLSIPQHLCPSLRTLNVRANRLSSDTGVTSFPALERLDLRDNRLKSIDCIGNLGSLNDLRELWMTRNPIAKSVSYRSAVFKLFTKRPSALSEFTLDAQGPSASEKRSLYDGKEIPRSRSSDISTLQAKAVSQAESQEDGADVQTVFCKPNTDLPKPSIKNGSEAGKELLPSKLIADKHESTKAGGQLAGQMEHTLRAQEESSGCDGRARTRSSLKNLQQGSQASINHVSAGNNSNDGLLLGTERVWLSMDSFHQEPLPKELPDQPNMSVVPSIADPLLLSMRNHEIIHSF